MARDLKISVVVPALNEEKLIEKCLQSLSNQSLSRKDYEIIVVDGGSTDKTLKIADKYADKIIKNIKSIGKARDIGLRKAKAEIVAYTDADTIVPNNWLDCMLTSYEDGVLGVTGPIKPLENKILGKISFFIYNSILQTGVLLKEWGAIGNNFSVKKKAVQKVGGFIFPVYEEFEIWTKLNKIGRTRYISDLYVVTSARRYLKLTSAFKNILYGTKAFLMIKLGMTPENKWERVD